MLHETQCVHVFEINFKRCKVCDGQNKACRCYEPRGETAAPGPQTLARGAPEQDAPLWGTWIE